jgi:hypothetical protein
MKSVLLDSELFSLREAVRAKEGHARTWGSTAPAECLESLAGGIPRGAITEIFGAVSSGRTSLLLSILAEATARQEFCALVDANDALDPGSAAAAGVDLKRLLWVRCAGNPECALKAADLLVHGGGFGVVAMDLADVEPQIVRRIPLASWFRLRRGVEHTPTVLLVIEREPYVRTCASLMLEMKREGVEWRGAPGGSQLLRQARFQPAIRKPVGRAPAPAYFEARAVG